MRLGEPIHQKEFTVNFIYLYDKLDKIAQGKEELPNPNNLRTIQNTILVYVDYGITQRLTLSGSFPAQFVDGNTPILNGKYSGLGDISLLANYKVIHPLFKSVPTVSLNFGFRFPTGSIDKKLQGTRIPDRVQLGSGIFSLLLGAESFYRASKRFSLFGNISTRISLGKNKYDYKVGNDLQLSLGNSFNTLSWLDLTSQVSYLYFATSKINGQTDGATGGKLFYLTPGIQISASNNLFLRAQVRFLLYKNVEGLQFLSEQTLVTNIGYRFNY